jgi:hypothetical protein
MRHATASSREGQLRNTATDRNVRLQDIHASLDEIFESPSRALSLARRDWNRRRGAELAGHSDRSLTRAALLRQRITEPRP